MKPEDVKLGYLLITSPIPNMYLGGAMITDARGLPLEFRYTEPIQPTKIQQILYGQVLSQYIKREVILETLLKSMDVKFKCLMVEDEVLLSYATKGYPLFRISETKSSPLGEAGKTQEISPTEFLVQVSGEISPLRLYFQEPVSTPTPLVEGTTATLTSSPEDSKLASIVDMLVTAGKSMDVCEPLKRIEKALEVICQEEGILSPTRS